MIGSPRVTYGDERASEEQRQGNIRRQKASECFKWKDGAEWREDPDDTDENNNKAAEGVFSISSWLSVVTPRPNS